MLAAGVGVTLLAAFPLAADEVWAPYVLLAVGLVEGLAALFATVSLRRHTGAHTRVGASAGVTSLVVLGFVLALL